MSEQRDIDSALESFSHHVDGFRWPTLPVNQAHLETIQLYYLSGRKYVFYLVGITVAGNSLKPGQGFKILHDIKRDKITQMYNNILPVHLAGERGWEVLTRSKMSIGDHPDFRQRIIPATNRYLFFFLWRFLRSLFFRL